MSRSDKQKPTPVKQQGQRSGRTDSTGIRDHSATELSKINLAGTAIDYSSQPVDKPLDDPVDEPVGYPSDYSPDEPINELADDEYIVLDESMMDDDDADDDTDNVGDSNNADDTDANNDQQPTSMFDPRGYEEPNLTAKIDPRFAVGIPHLLLVAMFCLGFWEMNTIAIRATDIWGHVAYGQWIIDHGSLPTSDMLCSYLTEPVVASAWLGQVILAKAWSIGGGELLSLMYALMFSATYAILAITFYQRSWNLWVTFLTTMFVIVLGTSRLFTLRPENFGVLCFAILVFMIAGREDTSCVERPPRPSRMWVRCFAVFVLFAFWANLHGSFPCGLILLGCCFAGQVIERYWHSRSIATTLTDPVVGRSLMLGIAATLGAMLTPYGPQLLLYALTFSSSVGHLTDLEEWRPLTVLGVSGREFMISLLMMMVFLRFSRQKFSVAHLLMLLVFGYATATGVRMIGWYSIVFGMAIVPHLTDILAQISPAEERSWQRCLPIDPDNPDTNNAVPKGKSFYLTLFIPLFVWVTFALSPVSRPIFGHPPRAAEQLHGNSTPVRLTQFLNEYAVEHADDPDALRMYNPQWWGDWIAFQGPESAEPFITTNVHLATPEHWRDYMLIERATPEWESIIAKHNIHMMVLDKSKQKITHGRLIHYAKASNNWIPVYEDEQGIVLVRTHEDANDLK